MRDYFYRRFNDVSNLDIPAKGGDMMVLLNIKDPLEAAVSKEISRLQSEMDRLFERFFGKGLPFFKSHEYPAVNVYHDIDNLYITAELPGVSIEDLDISLEENSITIKGQKKSGVSEDVSFHRKERDDGSFNRVIALPVKIDPEKGKATLKNGILTITLPKAEEAKPKKIDIKIG